jgi:hypothetical protein
MLSQMRSRTWRIWKTNCDDPAASQAGHDRGDRVMDYVALGTI